MKFIPAYFVFIISILLSCTREEKKSVVPKINSFDQLISVFSDPSSEYRSAPFWVWNNDVSKEDIDRTLA